MAVSYPSPAASTGNSVGQEQACQSRRWGGDRRPPFHQRNPCCKRVIGVASAPWHCCGTPRIGAQAARYTRGEAHSVAASMTTDAERQAQKAYWKEHSENATVEAMMLDSKAADIDKLERPEVGRAEPRSTDRKRSRPIATRMSPTLLASCPDCLLLGVQAGSQAAGARGRPAGRGAGRRDWQVRLAGSAQRRRGSGPSPPLRPRLVLGAGSRARWPARRRAWWRWTSWRT